MISEERITKTILKWLVSNSWEILCFDFPQSGTGRFLHPNAGAEKNLGSINPDIVAVKDSSCVFFENKNRYDYSDHEKVRMMRETTEYSNDIEVLLDGRPIQSIFYGIGYPQKCYQTETDHTRNMTDFIIGVSSQNEVSILYNPHEIPFV